MTTASRFNTVNIPIFLVSIFCHNSLNAATQTHSIFDTITVCGKFSESCQAGYSFQKQYTIPGFDKNVGQLTEVRIDGFYEINFSTEYELKTDPASVGFGRLWVWVEHQIWNSAIEAIVPPFGHWYGSGIRYDTWSFRFVDAIGLGEKRQYYFAAVHPAESIVIDDPLDLTTFYYEPKIIFADAVNSYYVLDSFGSFEWNYDLVRNVQFTITYSFVPEPATWATLVTGFGLIGGIARRRRKLLARQENCYWRRLERNSLSLL